MSSLRPTRSTRASSGRPAVIIGAGPHGLAAAAHLREAGVATRSFGEPLEFWRSHMPAGMVLRSRKRSSNIADPRRSLTIDRYEQASGKAVRTPPMKSLLLNEFVDYGFWFQRQAVPDIDRRKVAKVSREDGSFRVVLDDGAEVEAERVVVAAGLSPFPSHPRPFTGLPRSLVSHSFDHVDLSVFAEQRVVVVGAGQSALESAALLSENGASVEVLVRSPAVWWLDDADEPARRSRVAIPKPPTDVGGTVNGWIAAAPDIFRRLPQALQPWVSYRCIRPAGSAWLRPRLEHVPIVCARSVVAAEQHQDRARLILDDGSERIADHVLLGTGYDIDVARYSFLAPELAAEIAVTAGYPRLGPGLESSVPGLHFMGAPAALSFGPIMRFVVGSWYGAPALTRRVLGRSQPPIRFSF